MQELNAPLDIDYCGHSIGNYAINEALNMRQIFRLIPGRDQDDEVGREFRQQFRSSTQRFGQGCHYCGETVTFGIDGDRWWALSPCKYPTGVSCVFHLDVPSGAIIVANDLRRLIPGDPDTGIWPPPSPDQNYDVNSAIGSVNTTYWYAEHKMAHAFVGNTMAGLYADEPGHYHMGRSLTFTDSELEAGADDSLAIVCTDLWWYSIMDEAEFITLGGVIDGHWAGPQRVEIPAGNYRFTHHWHQRDFNQDHAKIYTSIERMGAALYPAAIIEDEPE